MHLPEFITLEDSTGDLTPESLDQMLSLLGERLSKHYGPARQEQILSETRAEYSKHMGKGGLARISCEGMASQLRRVGQDLDMIGKNLSSLAAGCAEGMVSIGAEFNGPLAAVVLGNITGMLGVAQAALETANDLLESHALGKGAPEAGA